MPKGVWDFLVSISTTKGFPPQELLSEFEVNRLNFTSLGTYKDMHPLKAKMVQGCFILIRVLLGEILLNAFTTEKKFSRNKRNERNLKGFVSVFYLFFMDILRANLAFQPSNQKHLPEGKKIIPQAHPIQWGVPETTKEHKTFRERELIEGLYPRDSVNWLYAKKKMWVDNIKALMEHWLDKLFNAVNEASKR